MRDEQAASVLVLTGAAEATDTRDTGAGAAFAGVATGATQEQSDATGAWIFAGIASMAATGDTDSATGHALSMSASMAASGGDDQCAANARFLSATMQGAGSEDQPSAVARFQAGRMAAAESADDAATGLFAGLLPITSIEATDNTQATILCFAITQGADDATDAASISATMAICARGRKGGIYMHAGVTGDTTGRELGDLDRELTTLVGQYGLGQQTDREDFAAQSKLAVAYLRKTGENEAEIYIRLSSTQSISRTVDTSGLSLQPSSRTPEERDAELGFFAGNAPSVQSRNVERPGYNMVTRPVLILMPTALGLAQLGAEFTVSQPRGGAT
jgi:hypothetical protein